ncbi:hypothetical protein OG593_38660 (plasmid) [Streptomyces atratus]
MINVEAPPTPPANVTVPLAVLRVGDELDEAAEAVGLAVGGEGELGDQYVVAFVAGLLLGQPERGDLRLAEGRGRPGTGAPCTTAAYCPRTTPSTMINPKIIPPVSQRESAPDFAVTGTELLPALEPFGLLQPLPEAAGLVGVVADGGLPDAAPATA